MYLGVTLGANHVGDLLLLRSLDKKASTLGILLCYLLELDGLSEFSSESQVCDANIVKDDAEVSCSCIQSFSALHGHNFSLRDQLCGIVLSLESGESMISPLDDEELYHNSLEDFVADGRKNTLIIVGAIVLER